MRFDVCCIVEGHGEVEAVPVLLRRIQQQISPHLHLEIPRPIRQSRYKLVKESEIEHAVQLAQKQIQSPGAILILIDADDDLPCQLGPVLLQRATNAVSPTIPVSVVVAQCEYEAWFLAASESIRGCRGISSSLPAHDNPDSVSDPKGTISYHMGRQRRYSETLDQPALSAVFDMQAAANSSPSFNKLWRDVTRILGQQKLTDSSSA